MEDHLAIHVINRAQIMDDALNLAKSDLLDYETALSVTGYLSKEVEYVPWASALTGGVHQEMDSQPFLYNPVRLVL